MTVDAQRIKARAAQVDVAALFGGIGRMLVALLAYLFASIGWTARAVVFAVMWTAYAVAEGYNSGPGKSGSGKRAGTR